MRVVCVSIARPRDIKYRGRTINTGIFKMPVKGPVAVRRFNIEGDGQAGTARLEVSQPRDPCAKLAIKMGSPNFSKRFLASGRVGFYLSVIKEGELAAGDRVRCVRTDPDSLTVRRVSQLAHNGTAATADTRRAAELSALSPQWRRRFLDQLERRATV